MKLLLPLLLTSCIASAQFNKKFVAKTDLFYDRLEYCGNGLFGFETNGKIGYMDVNEKVIIPANLDLKLYSSESIPSFTNGFAVIKQNGKQGVIDKTGKLVVPCDYSSLWFYAKENLLKASKVSDGKTLYGLISLQNKVIIPLEYTSINLEKSWVTVGQKGKYGLKDLAGKDVLPIEYSSLVHYADENIIKAEKDGKYGFIDLKGNWLFEKTKSVYALFDCTNGLIKCKVNGKYGFLDKKGNEVITTRYDNADGFNEFGIARVSNTNADTKYKTLYGYINKKGEEVIPLKYEMLTSFTNGLANAKDPDTNRFGFLDKTGKWVLKPIYIYASNSFDNAGGAWVKMTDDKYHYINKTGADLGILDSADVTSRSFKDGYHVAANTNYPYALINQSGKIIKMIDDCDGIYSFSENFAGYKSKKTGQFGYIDLNGNKIGSAEFTGFSGFSEGVARVAKTINGKTKHGYINTRGEIVIPFDFDAATSFKDGWAVVTKDSTQFFIDRKGNLKAPPRKYNQLSEFKSGFSLGTIKNENGFSTYYYINTDLKEAFNITAKSAYAFWDDVAVINRDTVYELINKKGESIKILDDIDFLKFSNEEKLAARSNGKWGFIDMKGNRVTPFQYDSCDSFKDGYAKVQIAGKWGIIDKTGKTIIEPAYTNISIGENGIFIFYNSKWGIIDKNKTVLSREIFLTITSFVNNKALARLSKSFTILKSPLIK